MKDTKNIQLNPPYISINKFQRVLDLLSTRSFPELSLDDFTTRGFSKVEAFQSLHALRFLGLISEDGKLTEDAKFLALKGENRTLRFREMVKRAYKKLFDLVENPSALPRDELYNEFIAEYSLSPRLIKGTLPLFLWLSKEAGLEVIEAIEPRKRSASSSRKTNPLKNEKVEKRQVPDQAEQETSLPEHAEYHRLEISKLILLIPKNPTTDLLIAKGKLVEITGKIEEFAKKANLLNDVEETNADIHEAG